MGLWWDKFLILYPEIKNKAFSKIAESLCFQNGALGRNRTGTALRPTDFKSDLLNILYHN